MNVTTVISQLSNFRLFKEILKMISTSHVKMANNGTHDITSPRPIACSDTDMRIVCSHRRTGRENKGGLQPPPPPPPKKKKFEPLRLFGQEEKFGESQFLKNFHVFVCLCVVFFVLLFFFFRKDRYFLF